MSKKVVGISIATGIGIGLGYLGYKYGRQFLTYLKQRDDRKSINDIAEDIKATLKKNMEDLCKKTNGDEDEIQISNSNSEKTLSEFLEGLKNLKVDKKTGDKHVLSEDKAEKNLEIEINLKDDEEEEEVKENKIKSVEDLNREYDKIIHEMNAETYKVLDILKARREDLAKKENEEEKKEVVSEEKAEKKPTTKKNIKVEGGKKKSDSNKKSTKGTSDKKVEETAE